MDINAPYVGLDILRYEQTSLDGANWHLDLRFGSWPGTGLSGVTLGLVLLDLNSYAVAG